MKVFYINLDTAKERRNKFNDVPYERWKATTRQEVPTHISGKMVSMYNFGKDAHLARCACWLSHTRLLEHIVENKINDVLILEDDAIKMNNLPKDYPKDSITYVGGFLYNRKMMDSKPPVIAHQVGINLCPQEFRILGCLAYIVPRWSVALHILNRIYSENRYKAIDIMMGNIGIKQYYNYPASFREEGCESQISEKNKNNKIQTEEYEYISMNKYNASRCQKTDKQTKV
tara:strand:+ start:2164 stop:2853 length:690 start_codon:yes stop_codon:yes gene_type:complete